MEAVVKIIFVGPLRTVFGCRELSLAAGDGETVRELLRRLANAAGGRGAEYLSDENPEQFVVSVHGEVVSDLAIAAHHARFFSPGPRVDRGRCRRL